MYTEERVAIPPKIQTIWTRSFFPKLEELALQKKVPVEKLLDVLGAKIEKLQQNVKKESYKKIYAQLLQLIADARTENETAVPPTAADIVVVVDATKTFSISPYIYGINYF